MFKGSTFVSGNSDKAAHVGRYLNISHTKLHIPEIQSLEPREIVKHKAIEAFRQVQSPVLVDDTSLVFLALKKLPGPLIKLFLEQLKTEGMCKLLNGYNDRSAVATSFVGLYSGIEVIVFEASLNGKIAEDPRGGYGFGWDAIFIPQGYEKTRAEMTEEERNKTSVRKDVLAKVKKYLMKIV